MRFLRSTLATGTVEWVATAVAVVVVVMSLIWSLSHTTAAEGEKTRAWIDGIPDPGLPTP
jgi:hypothetical protein